MKWQRIGGDHGPGSVAGLAGYATEAAREPLRSGFTECGLDRVTSIRHIDELPAVDAG